MRTSVIVVIVTIALAIVSAVGVGWFLVRLPPDYFVHRHTTQNPTKLLFQRIGGALLIVLGAVMSVPGVPGQGLLTILLGLMLMDLPFLRPWELRIIRLPAVLRALTRLRLRAGRPPLQIPHAH